MKIVIIGLVVVGISVVVKVRWNIEEVEIVVYD